MSVAFAPAVRNELFSPAGVQFVSTHDIVLPLPLIVIFLSVISIGLIKTMLSVRVIVSSLFAFSIASRKVTSVFAEPDSACTISLSNGDFFIQNFCFFYKI